MTEEKEDKGTKNPEIYALQLRRDANVRIVQCCERCANCNYSEEDYINCQRLGNVYGHTEYVVCNLFKWSEWDKDSPMKKRGG